MDMNMVHGGIGEIKDDDKYTRTRVLVEELGKVGLSLRNDSRLCDMYINGGLNNDWNLDRIVRECALMHWLFLYTPYPDRCRHAYHYFSNIFANGTTVHNFIRHNIQPHIKADTIMEMGGVPEVWPWM